MQTAHAYWLAKSEPDGFCREQQAANPVDMQADAPLRRPVTLAAIEALPAHWPPPCHMTGRQGEAWRR
jgi:hypothetical protein